MRVDPRDGREDRAFGGRTVGRPRVKSDKFRDKFRDTRKYQLPGKGARTDCLGLKSWPCHILTERP